MSWFLGHLFPASMWLAFGLFFWLQSMNKLAWTNKFRTQPRWLAFRSVALMVVSLLGTAGEILVPFQKGEGFKGVNSEHIIVWFGLFLCAMIETLNLYKVLPEPVWAMIPPISFSFLSVMFMLHEQPLYYWRLLHITTGLFALPLVVLLGMWAVKSQRSSMKAHSKGKLRDRDGSVGCCFWKGKNIEDLNGTYTDQKIYDTVIPGFTAFFLILQSMCWFEMMFEMGPYTMSNLPHEAHHAEHKMLSVVIRDICASATIMAVVSFVARTLESFYNRNSNIGNA